MALAEKILKQASYFSLVVAIFEINFEDGLHSLRKSKASFLFFESPKFGGARWK